MSYSFSRLPLQLENGARTAKVYSTYMHHDQFPSYVIQVTLHLDGSKVWHRIQKSFSRIDLAESYHQDVVLRLVGKGYNIISSTCK